MPKIGAAGAADRIILLDGLRGLALFGILIANIRSLSGWAYMEEARQVELAGAAITYWDQFFHYFLIDGKFYTIFSLVFGVSFFLQMERLSTKTDFAGRIFMRRMLVLLGIGLVHIIFVYHGDILTLYALVGMILLLARNWSDRALLIAAVILLLTPLAAASITYLTQQPIDTGLNDLGVKIAIALGARMSDDQIAWFLREDMQGYLSKAMSFWLWRIDYMIVSFRFFKVLAMMLLGLWAGRHILANGLLDNRRLLKRICVWGLIIGLPTNLAYAMTGGFKGQTSPDYLQMTIFYLGVAPLGLAYAAGFALAWPKAKRWLGVLAAPGRMALTNYLMQSVLCVTIFYGIGFGFMGQVPPQGFYAIGCAIFAVQIILSNWWLAHFGQGPMERLWRLGTYGRAKTGSLVDAPASA
jgi:uncharacterized protein